jgi:hypothetical protein
MRRKLLATMSMTLGLVVASSQAEELRMPPGSRQAVALPDRGASMAQVEQRFGAPTDRIAAVGQPPIARWLYPSFVVYFEGNLVIHAVARTASPTPQS